MTEVRELETLLKGSLREIRQLKQQVQELRSARSGAISAIGLALRFPGAINVDEYWSLLREGKDVVREIPPERFTHGASRGGSTPTHADGPVRWAGLLDDVTSFDASRFGLTPREALSIDPQHRLLLEVVYEALENAGIAPSSLAGSATGVFVGITTTDYVDHLREAIGDKGLDVYAVTGNGHSFAAGRIAYTFGLRGPCFAIDTACSSSLVALHQACQALRAGECDLAIVAGVNLILSPHLTEAMVALSALSPDGRCRTFDARANGFVRGEGCAAIVLRHARDAAAAREPVWAQILGSAVNHDGRSSGLTAPNVLAQRDVLRAALSAASTKPGEVDYVETHGTGTALGDPIELEALRAVWKDAPKEHEIALGAVKANIGHLEACAGLAGVVKVILAMKHGVRPPQPNFETLNPRASLAGTSFVIPTQPSPWPVSSRARVSGVSAFGMSGTNAHVVIQGVPDETPAPEEESSPKVLALSAASARGLTATAAAWKARVAADPCASVLEICATAAFGRDKQVQRAAAVVTTRASLDAALTHLSGGAGTARVFVGDASKGRPRIAFLFTGQGAQYPGMASRCYEQEPAFRAAFDRCVEIAREHAGLELGELVFRASESELERTEYAQPALFAVEYAVAALWEARGVRPDVVLGHSLGELVAACIAGVFDLSTALRLAVMRGKLMASVPSTGAMVVVRCQVSELEQDLARYSGRVEVAATNTPSSTTLSGDRDALTALRGELTARALQSEWLRVSHAFHSAHMQPILGAFERELADVTFAHPRTTFVSSATASIEDERLTSAKYWCDQLRGAVRFAEASATLVNLGVDVTIEVGPHPNLSAMLLESTPHRRDRAIASLHRKMPDELSFAIGLAQLFVAGGTPDFGDAMKQARRVHLPGTASEATRYWVDRTRAADCEAACRSYVVAWRPAPVPVRAPREDAAAKWAVFSAGECQASRSMVEALEAGLARHGAVLTDRSAEATDRVLVCGAGGDAADLGVVLSQLRSAIADAQAETGLVRLWVITEAASRVDNGLASREPPNARSAAIAGLLRSFGREYPSLLRASVDLPMRPSSADIDRVVERFTVGEVEPESALRGGAWFVPRLTPAPAGSAGPGAGTAAHIRSDATYLVTGGFGALGMATAEWLVRQGARHLALAVRRATASPETQGRLDALMQAGVAVRVFVADVGQRDDVARVLRAISDEMAPLRGVFHAAGVLHDASFAELDDAAYARVFGPKADAARHLDELTGQVNLDLFVLYSSAAGVLGSAGQCNYAAANAYLDALAERRRARGLAGLSIAWGAFSVGMAARGHDRIRARRREFGVLDMTPETGLSALQLALSGAAPAATILFGAFDWGRIASHASRSSGELWAELVPAVPAMASVADPASVVGLLSFAGLSQAEVEERLVDHLRAELAVITGQDASAIDPARGFSELGLDSLMAVELRDRLQLQLGIRLEATLALQCRSVDGMAKALSERVAPRREAAPAQTASPRIEQVVRATPHDERRIAIVGAASRLPGEVASLDELWSLLAAKREPIVSVPRERWDAEALYDANPLADGKSYARLGGFIRDVDRFDPSFFRMGRSEAALLDPQQRLLLVLAWEALENAAIVPSTLRGSKTGVFVGISSGDYSALIAERGAGSDLAYAALGNAHALAAGRISYFLGLEGPSLALDTACSSSLVALHQAMVSLRTGESDVALCGGISLMLTPQVTVALCKLRALSPTDRCHVFDESADGYVRGEGGGIFVLKRLSDAEQAGDPILAILQGSAVNHDGASSGLTVPNQQAQVGVIRAALADAGVAPAELEFVEAHGTGTALGDPIEVHALGEVFADRVESAPLHVGSIKANVGHLEVAAGVASVMKALACLRHGIPPQPLYERGNPHIEWSRIPIRVEAQRTLPAPRLVGVSSFGLSGTNAHVVMRRPEALPVPSGVHAPRLLLLSAHSEASLRARAAAFADFLEREAASLGDAVYTANVRREHMAWRVARPISDAVQLCADLRALAAASPGAAVVTRRADARRPRLLWCFGSEHSASAELSTDIESLLRGWELGPQLEQLPEVRLLARHLVSARRLFERGVRPTHLAGVGIGGVAAALLAGVLSELQVLDALRAGAAPEALVDVVGIQRTVESPQQQPRYIEPHAMASWQELLMPFGAGLARTARAREIDPTAATEVVLTTLYLAGYACDFARFASPPGRPVDLPRYPFEADSLWVGGPRTKAAVARGPLQLDGLPDEEKRKAVELALAEQLAEFLDLEEARLDRHRRLFELGVDSLLLMRLCDAMRGRGLDKPLRVFLDADSLSELAGQLVGAGASNRVEASESVQGVVRAPFPARHCSRASILFSLRGGYAQGVRTLAAQRPRGRRGARAVPTWTLAARSRSSNH